MLSTKQDFINCLKDIIDPLKKYYTPKKAGIKLGHFEASYPEETARAEAFASKNRVLPSVIDGLASGIGYTLAVVAVAFVRELLGTGVLFAAADGTGGWQVLGDWYSPATIFIMPAGAFLTLGVLCAAFNSMRSAAAKRAENKEKHKKEAEAPAETEAAV